MIQVNGDNIMKIMTLICDLIILLIWKLLGKPTVPEYIDDGFGNSWNAECQNCGAPMQIIRPGDARCSDECYSWE